MNLFENNKKFLGIILFALSLAYPLIIYFLGSKIPASSIVLGLVFVLMIRSIIQYKSQSAINLTMTLLAAGAMIGLFFLDEQMAVFAYPVVMSLSFALLLGWTLLYPPSLIERFARIVEPDLDPAGIEYTRKATYVWLIFSLLNAGISLATALMNNKDIWLLYNGFISYVLIGLLMGGEYLFRKYYRAKMKKGAFVPAHLLLVRRKDEFWKKYWNSTEFPSYSRTIGTLAAKIKETDAKRVFLICEDRAYFLAGFLATLYGGLPVVLPQSAAPELLKELMQPGDLLLSNQPELAHAAPLYLSINLSEPATSHKFNPLDPKHATVIFYTSGSTGKPKAVEKKLDQLEAEAAVLHTLWGQGNMESVSFISTVSHHHLYAFLYSLLWPVCEGSKMERSTFTYWEDVIRECKQDTILISSPAHLERFFAMSFAKGSFRFIFSSGGPLSYEAAGEINKNLGSWPIEVYGSTETGGIACRQQIQPAAPWQRFDCVELSQSLEGKLRVKSPYLEANESFQTEDLILGVDANTFHLIGRGDRIVKVEGKRVSLKEIEERLCRNHLVAQAAIIVLEKSFRDELGALIVLTPAGMEELQACGKRALKRKLQASLSLYFHPVVIPRRWRFIDAIPVNTLGKCLPDILKKYFEKSSLGPICEPIILSKHVSENSVDYSLRIPPDLAYFEGHFKHMPVVPGVVQLHWAAGLAKIDLGLIGEIAQCSQIKFTKLMRPNDEISLTLAFNKKTSTLSYHYKGGGDSYSSGRMIFSAGAPNEI